MAVTTAGAPARCAACDGESTRVVWRENGYEGRACVCGTVCTWPTPAADAVDPLIDGHPDRYYSGAAHRRVRWLQRYRPSGRLLEIGCGEGHFLAAATAAGYEVRGIEPHPGRARRAAARLGVAIDCAFLEAWSPHAERFDIVYHCDLLSHFPDPLGALRTMAALLRPGGVLAFEVGLLGDVAPDWYARINVLGYPQHRWLYSERSLRILLGRADLELAHSRRFGLGLATLFVAGVRALARTRHPRLRHPRPRRVAEGSNGQGRASGFVDGLEAFWRYDAGRVMPGFGPGTLFAIAIPQA
jgi:SAM-dependent methyltransferase